MFISDSIQYVGVNDNDIDLFESQYIVPNGISYNSYIIRDEKTALMDTVDIRKFDAWETTLNKTLGDIAPDYLVIQHLEPDHAGSIARILKKYPNITLVGNAKTFAMLPQFFNVDENVQKMTVKEGDTLSLGSHTLTFIMAPMVHWPEVMVSYESSEKVLFSADAFGKFGAIGTEEDWACEARRYYFNIVGKYGSPVQTLIKKMAAREIEKICPLHGPVLDSDLEYYINLYNTWSSYTPEKEGVFIAYASVYGNTKGAALLLKALLEEKGVKVSAADLARDDMAECIEDAFKYSKLVCAAPSYDGGVFPAMADFIHHLKSKAFQNRTVALVENGSWAPSAARTMKAEFETMKNITLTEQIVTIKSTMKEADRDALAALADALAK